MKLKRNIEVCWRAGGTPTEISTKFGLNWLCEPGDKSYKPQYFFSISMKNGSLLTIVYKFIIGLAGNFFPYHYMLGTTVKGAIISKYVSLLKSIFINAKILT